MNIMELGALGEFVGSNFTFTSQLVGSLIS